jgi:hypothetical protein
MMTPQQRSEAQTNFWHAEVVQDYVAAVADL